MALPAAYRTDSCFHSPTQLVFVRRGGAIVQAEADDVARGNAQFRERGLLLLASNFRQTVDPA
jgi:hypothetical protein